MLEIVLGVWETAVSKIVRNGYSPEAYFLEWRSPPHFTPTSEARENETYLIVGKSQSISKLMFTKKPEKTQEQYSPGGWKASPSAALMPENLVWAFFDNTLWLWGQPVRPAQPGRCRLSRARAGAPHRSGRRRHRGS